MSVNPIKHKLVERTYIDQHHQYYQIIDDLSWKAKNLFNVANYHIRQEFFTNHKYIGFFDLYHLLKQADAYRDLPTKVSKQIVKRVAQTWKGYFAAHKDWKKNPSKYLGEPKIPHYLDKEKGRYVVIYPPDALSRPALKKGIVKLSMSEVYLPTQITEKVLEVRFVPRDTCYIMEVVYEKEDTPVSNNPDVLASIDCGLNNLVTLGTNQPNIKPLIINGKGIKSINRWYNKARAVIQSQLTGKQKTTAKLKAITAKRNRQIESALHTASKLVIDYCLENQVSRLAIGYNSQWKQSINIGKKNNQNFVQIPHRKLIDQIKYKAALVGIEVVETEESYTSKCSALDLEPIQKHESYMGKRVKRGLFKTATGLLVNADWNGLCNIGRKVFGNEFVSNLIGALPLSPRLVNPI